MKREINRQDINNVVNVISFDLYILPTLDHNHYLYNESITDYNRVLKYIKSTYQGDILSPSLTISLVLVKRQTLQVFHL